MDAMAKDGEVAPLVQPFLRRHRYEVADAVIKALDSILFVPWAGTLSFADALEAELDIFAQAFLLL